MDRAHASRAEADRARRAKEAIRNQRTHARRRGSGPIPTLEFIWRLPRRAVVEALGLQRTKEDDGGSSNDLQKLAELEGAQRDAAQHLVGLGFRPGQAVEAVATTDTNDALEATEKALAHLCLHVDESDLPETFDPKSGANLDVVVSRKASHHLVCRGRLRDEVDNLR